MKFLAWGLTGMVGLGVGMWLSWRLCQVYQGRKSPGPPLIIWARIVGLVLIVSVLYGPEPEIAPWNLLYPTLLLPLGWGLMIGDFMALPLLQGACWFNPGVGEWLFEQLKPTIESMDQQVPVARQIAIGSCPWSQCPKLRRWVLEHIAVEVLVGVSYKREAGDTKELLNALIAEGEEQQAVQLLEGFPELVQGELSAKMGRKLIRAESARLRKAGFRALGKNR